jgi:long-chain acyl-CoA synthetase
MKGYYRNPSATEESISEGWFRTGDIGYIDEEGYLFVTGRSKEVIVLPSGKNIYPEEVEKFYLASLFIKEICVLGLQKDGRSESLHAVVVPDLEHAKEEQTADIREKIKWEINEISAEMPSYMRVTGFTLSADPLPRTALGKIRRFMVKESLTGRTAPEKGGEASKAVTDEVAKKIVGLLHEITGTTQPIGTEDSLELDVGLDSLSRIELAASLERTFSLKLPEDFLNRPETVGELIERIRAGMSEGVAAALSWRPDWKQILSATPPEESLKIVSLRPSACATAAAFIVHSFLRLLFLLAFRLRARDVGNIPDQGNFILASNHSSYLDGFAVILSLPFSCFRRIYTLGLSDFFAGPVKGRFARIAHVIPIDSASFLNKALQVSSHVLREGRSLSVFPEGGRSVDGSLMEFKKGVGILAVELGIPVVPVYIRGAYEALPRGAAWPKCRMITVTFGRPLNSADMDFGELPEGKDRYQLFADALRELVQRLKGQAAP